MKLNLKKRISEMICDQISSSHRSRIGEGLCFSALGLVLVMCLASSAFSQLPRTSSDSDRDRTRALPTEESRAEMAADELVALSPDMIVSVLRKEPGLLLQVKRAIVRKAYEQGRLVAPKDLEDEALFRLIQEDQNARVLVTHEIEDRYYIRAKPRREELQSGVILEPRVPGKEAGSAKNEEEMFWATHERVSEHYPEPEPIPATNAAQTAVPTMPLQQQMAPGQLQRQLNRTQFQSPQDDLYEGLPGDIMTMPRASQDELRTLLAASSSGDSSSSLFGGTSGLGMSSGFGSSSGLGLSNVGLTGGLGDAMGGGLSASQAAALAAMASGGSGNSLQAPMSLNDQTQQGLNSMMLRQQQWPQMPPRREIQADQRGLHHPPNPYADVPSLYELYSQYSAKSGPLQRFGLDVFTNGTGNFDVLPMDMPVGPEYVLGPGDGLSINLWGSVSQRLQRVVDRQGRVMLPEVGAVPVAGRNLGDVQRLVQSVLRTQFTNVDADVSLARLRTVRVYVVGDVEHPGPYDVSSLSTPLNAVYDAGGPTSRGSIRTIVHKRGNEVVQQVDVYDLLLHGIRSDMKGLQPGDTIFVPPLGAEITVEGMVRRPAIYELGQEKNLAEVLELSGGVLQSGTLRHVDVERVESHLSRTMLRLDIPEDGKQETVTQALIDFKIQDGDKIKISPILPYADKAVYLEGHVFHPGKFAYSDGMKVTDIIKSYSDLMPEPYKQHAEIIRLNAPDYKPTVLAFNLEDALAGKDQDLVLKPFDTVRIFGRFDFEDPPLITVTGQVRDPGDHITNGATYLRDAIYLAGGTTPDAELQDVQVFRKTQDGKLRVLSVNLSDALSGDPKDNVLLEPKDRVFVHKNLSKADPAMVKVEGQVERPGTYPLGEDMTAAELVRVAGGLKRGAYTEMADLTRYEVEHGADITSEHQGVPIGRALAGEPDTDVRLRDGDVLTVRQIAGWNDVGATIAVTGQVALPGTYGIQEGERLSSILERAGGLRSDAYPYGAVFQRVQVRELEQKSRAQLVSDVESQGAVLQNAPANDADQKLAKDAAINQWQSTLDHLLNTPPSGRLVIHISKDIKRWANTPADIEVRAGDSIYIPKRPSLVTVDGSVYNPTAVSYKPGKSAGWYLRQAGGPTNNANKKATFVIRADGSVVGGSGGMFTGSAENAVLLPGDMVVVPEKGFSANTRWKNTLEASQLAYAIGIAIEVARSF